MPRSPGALLERTAARVVRGTVYTDARTGTLTIAGSAGEARVAADGRAGTLSLAGTATEARSAADARAGALLVAGSGSGGWLAVDARGGTVTFAGGRQDARTATDATGGQVALAGSGADLFGRAFVDQAVGSLGASGSAVEAVARSSGGPGTVALTGAPADAFSAEDKADGSVPVAGEAGEGHAATDAGAGMVELSGGSEEAWSAEPAVIFEDAATGVLALAGWGVGRSADLQWAAGQGGPPSLPITPRDWKDRPSALAPQAGETLAEWETRAAAYAAANPGALTPIDAAAMEDLETRVGAYADALAAGKQDAASAATQAELDAAVALLQLRSERGQANGYASLDGSSKVPAGQIPAVTAAMVAADVATQAELDAAIALLQLRSEKGAASGYASLDSGTKVPAAQLASGTPDGSKFLRDDRTWAIPAGGGGGSGLPANIVNRTTAYTASAGDFVLADASSAGFTVTLPAGTVGQLITVKKVDGGANPVAVVVTGGGTIDGDAGGASITSPQFGAIFECSAVGVWRVVAPTSSGGSNGVDGKTVRSGSGAPSAGLGVDGDFYIRTDTNQIYGPKTSGAWGSPTNIQGPQGTAGTNGTNGILSTFQDEGAAVTARAILDVQGNGAGLSQDGTKLILSVPGGQPLAATGATAATRFVGGTNSGAPSSGTFAVGDFVIARDGAIFICTTAGTPGTWVQVSGGGGSGELGFMDPSILAPFSVLDIGAAGVLGAANRAVHARARARKSGTLLGYLFYLGSGGNGTTDAVDVGVYAAAHAQLHHSGAIILPVSGNGWKFIGPTGISAELDALRIGGAAPALSITAGTYYDLALSSNSNTPSFAFKNGAGAPALQLVPAALMPGAPAAADWAGIPSTAHPLPDPLPDGGQAALIGLFGIIG